MAFFIPHHTIVSYGFTLVIRVSTRSSVSSSLCHASVHSFVVRPSVRLSLVRSSVFSFPDDNLSKYLLIITKLNMCIDILEIWYRIVNGQISSIFYFYLPPYDSSEVFQFTFLFVTCLIRNDFFGVVQLSTVSFCVREYVLNLGSFYRLSLKWNSFLVSLSAAFRSKMGFFKQNS